MNVPIEFIVLFLGMVLASGGWMIRYMVQAVNATNISLQSISEHLSRLNGRVGMMETRVQLHEKHDDERHDAISRDTDELWRIVNGRGS